MWFTRVSLHNPVLATMVMLALVVLGLVSYQRMQTDQFPNVDFPVVVISTSVTLGPRQKSLKTRSANHRRGRQHHRWSQQRHLPQLRGGVGGDCGIWLVC